MSIVASLAYAREDDTIGDGYAGQCQTAGRHPADGNALPALPTGAGCNGSRLADAGAATPFLADARTRCLADRQQPLDVQVAPYQGPAWQEQIPPDSPTPQLDRTICRLMYATHCDEEAVARALAASDAEHWHLLLERWDAIRAYQRAHSLGQFHRQHRPAARKRVPPGSRTSPSSTSAGPVVSTASSRTI